ncbi:SPX domain containing protein [Trema orientale]|uniref:SPX domain containing protein n=1 Tax=Trema orientale TaxID=63057 RepID=A0A2P5G098_TREOI|nr:SPX domain containing protein [Trema orientale]
MKFGKEFNIQKVPEWIEAYMDYNGLKSILRNMRQYKQNKHPALNRTLSGLNCQSSSHHREDDTEDDHVIDVNTLWRDGSRKFFETKFLGQSKEGSEIEVTFFRKLEEELNKVNDFYKDKVEEVIDEANQLNKQMEALIALGIKVKKRDFEGSNSNRHDQKEQSQSSVSREEVKVNDHNQDPAEVLEHVKMKNNTPQPPVSTIKGVFRDSKDEDLSFGKEDLRKANKQLRVAFIEFYHKLHLLKQYSLTTVSSQIIDLLERVEATFIKNFSNSDRREAMKSLRPKRKHRVTFFSGSDKKMV